MPWPREGTERSPWWGRLPQTLFAFGLTGRGGTTNSDFQRKVNAKAGMAFRESICLAEA